MPGIKRGDFVRVKRGVYRGDLAMVHSVDEARQRVTIKLIPRIDFNAWLQRHREKEEASEDEEGRRKRKRAPFHKGPPPPQKLFNVSEIRVSFLSVRFCHSFNDAYKCSHQIGQR